MAWRSTAIQGERAVDFRKARRRLQEWLLETHNSRSIAEDPRVRLAPVLSGVDLRAVPSPVADMTNDGTMAGSAVADRRPRTLVISLC